MVDIGRDSKGNEIYRVPYAADPALEAKIDAKADVAIVPVAGTGSPGPVVDSNAGSTGAAGQYAPFMHTHPSKVRKQIVTMPSAAATYVWVYPTAFPAGVIPVVSGIVQVPNGTTDLFNVQILGTPSNTQCTFQINRVSAGLLALLLGALSINSTPIAATLHMIALEQ